MRALCVVLVSVLVPAIASGQSSSRSVSIQAAAGPTIVDPGYSVSAAGGFSPNSRVTIFVDVQRTQLFSRTTHYEDGFGVFRGGTLTAVSGEVRVGFWPAHRVTPYALAGIGGGVSRPTVNADFPDPVTNRAGFIFFGGGVHVPLRERLSFFADARLLAGAEGTEGIIAIIPVRAGMAWRF